MNTLRRIATTFILALGVMAAPVYAAQDYAEESKADDPRFDTGAPPAYSMVADLVIVRPFAIVATAVGTGAFIISLPFTALGGNVPEAAEALVATPAREAFARCLGCTKPHNAFSSDSESDTGDNY